MENIIPVLWVGVAIVLLLFMTVKMKLHSMIALLLIAIFVAFMEGMDTVTLVKTITKGAGSTLGGVGLVIVLGAALGQLMTDCGASKKNCRYYCCPLWNTYVTMGRYVCWYYFWYFHVF